MHPADSNHGDFAIETRAEGATTVVAVAGELDVHTAPRLAAALESTGPAAAVVVDCSRVGFMDSTGLSVFVTAHQRARESGARLEVVVAEPAVRKVFAITGIDSVIPVHDRLDSALAGA